MNRRTIARYLVLLMICMMGVLQGCGWAGAPAPIATSNVPKASYIESQPLMAESFDFDSSDPAQTQTEFAAVVPIGLITLLTLISLIVIIWRRPGRH